MNTNKHQSGPSSSSSDTVQGSVSLPHYDQIVVYL